MLALLLGGGALYLLLGDTTEALVLIAFASFSVVVTVVQEARTERVLESLRDLSAPLAFVVRDGRSFRIPARELVRDDLIVLAQGDRIPADAVVLTAEDLQADESLLTGESVPVRKRAIDGKADDGDADDAVPGGEDRPFVYSGTLTTAGTGLARVMATGPRSALGKIGQSLVTLEPEPPRLRAETAHIVRLCAIGGACVALLVVVLFGVSRGNWIDALLAGIAIGMSMLPEEFPVVLTVFLAIGAWRIAQVRVLTRRAAAIETLGSASILCTDKTGTLTENRMTVARYWIPSGETAAHDWHSPPSGSFHHLIDAAVLASAPVPSDPMEIAFHEVRAAFPADPLVSRDWTLAHTHGLRPDLPAMSNVWWTGSADDHVVAAKGAPEAIARLCALNDSDRACMTRAANAMADAGLRVLGVATARAAAPARAGTQHDYAFDLAGLIGLADPVRADVPAAVAECQRAGIRVVMITGDYAKTAQSIALQAGIADGALLLGDKIDGLDDAWLGDRLRSVAVAARITPAQKLRIVSAFKAAGHIVAMTGDGVNDAPSLKAAHIGVAMGKRGTDVAREAAAIVLLDDDFGAIVQAVRLGRRIYDNIRKAMGFIFAVHVPIAGLAILPLALGFPILFGPIHIALLELIIDPVCALVFEAEPDEDNLMSRPPRDPQERLFSARMIAASLFQGGVVFAALTSVFLVATLTGTPEAEIRALTFFALVAAMVVLIIVNLTFTHSLADVAQHRNTALRIVLVAVAIVTSALMFVPPLQELMKFAPLPWADMLIVIAVGLVLGLLLGRQNRWLTTR